MDVSSSFYTLICTHTRVWAITSIHPSNGVRAESIWLVQAQKRAEMESRRRVCVYKCWCLTLSIERVLLHISQDFSCSTLLFTNVISTTGCNAKKWEEENLSTNTQVAAAGIICRSESALDECNQMESLSLSLSLSIPHALDNFNQHTHADEIKESDQCIFFMIHFLFLWDCMFTQFPF